MRLVLVWVRLSQPPVHLPPTRVRPERDLPHPGRHAPKRVCLWYAVQTPESCHREANLRNNRISGGYCISGGYRISGWVPYKSIGSLHGYADKPIGLHISEIDYSIRNRNLYLGLLTYLKQL